MAKAMALAEGTGLAFVARVAPAVRIDRQMHDQRLVGALRAAFARAEVAVDADGGAQILARLVKGFGIDQPPGMAARAAKRDDKAAVLGLLAKDRAVGRAGEGKELPAIGQFHELRDDDARRAEGIMDEPDRAGPALFGQREGGGVEAFGDVPRLIHP